MDSLLANLQRLRPSEPPQAQRRRGRSQALLAPAQPWQLSAASLVLVTYEVLYGASPAWQPEGYLGDSGAAPPRQEQEEGTPAAAPVLIS